MNSDALILRGAVRPDIKGQARLAGGQIYILPTWIGVTLGIALTTMLLGSLNYASNTGLAFTFLFGSVALVGMVHTWRNLLNLQVTATEATPIFAGQSTTFLICLSETQGLARAGLVVTAAGAAHTQATDLSALNKVDVTLSPIPQKRGLYGLGPLCIASSSPLGLFRAWAYVHTTVTVMVYPAPTIAQRWHPTVHYVPTAKGGKLGKGVDDFTELRAYQAGDSLKHIDWKALARGRDLVTKQFGGDCQEEIWLDWEAVGVGTIEEKLSRLCRLVIDATALNLSYGLRLPNNELSPASGDAHKHKCLTRLALFS